MHCTAVVAAGLRGKGTGIDAFLFLCARAGGATSHPAKSRNEKKEKRGRATHAPSQIHFVYCPFGFVHLVFIIFTPTTTPPLSLLLLLFVPRAPPPPTRLARRRQRGRGPATPRSQTRSAGSGRAGGGSAGRLRMPDARIPETVLWKSGDWIEAGSSHCLLPKPKPIKNTDTGLLLPPANHQAIILPTSSSCMATSTSAAPSPQKTALAKLAPCTPTVTRAPGRRATAAAMPGVFGVRRLVC